MNSLDFSSMLASF